MLAVILIKRLGFFSPTPKEFLKCFYLRLLLILSQALWLLDAQTWYHLCLLIPIVGNQGKQKC